MPLVALLAHPLSVDLRQAIVRVFERVGATFHIVKQILAPHQEGNAAAAAAAAAVDQAHEHQSQSLLAPESSSPFTNDHPTSGDVNTTSQNLLEFASANAIAPSSSISVHSDHTGASIKNGTLAYSFEQREARRATTTTALACPTQSATATTSRR